MTAKMDAGGWAGALAADIGPGGYEGRPRRALAAAGGRDTATLKL